MPEKFVYICYGWDDYEGGRNYIVFDAEEKAKVWVEESKRLTTNYWGLSSEKRKKVEKQLEAMCSEENDNFRYEKMRVVS